MAKHSHVPKFGNWDSDNIPYTAYFDNARKEKAGVRMNPNDPEENPEAFMYGRGDQENDVDFRPVQAPPHVDLVNYSPVEVHNIEGHMGHNPQDRNTFDHRMSGRHKGIRSESGSDRSTSDHSLRPPGQRRLKSDPKKGLGEGGNSFSPSVQGHSRQRSGSYPSEATHHRIASVPKFGVWDETDPKSGEGFTVIFNKVKEEKQVASTTFPTAPSQASIHSDIRQRKNAASSSKSKLCCCLFSRGSD